MTEDKKRKKPSGYDILKSKIAKKDAEIAKLKEQLDKENTKVLKDELNLWKSRCNVLEQRIKETRLSLNNAIKHMGWLRRKIFKYC